ncbi:hypothetical protein EAH_00050930 [Eimeria acervulina]|uniref:Uncharacterized protein n=1 Tax=Eimeria acervulina TaxID=5801 RepID=U6GVQ3_EIMAC|nr:hypothetical protein EAH_00050930 [Eimeria acervulina]CDI84265.1 hypothetical protein EAH_00050930 [Eimeria acervulina]
MGRSLAPRPLYECDCGSLRHQASGGGRVRRSSLSVGPESPFLFLGVPRPPRSRLLPQSDSLSRQLQEALRQPHGIKPPVTASTGMPRPAPINPPQKSTTGCHAVQPPAIPSLEGSQTHSSHFPPESPKSPGDGLSLHPSTLPSPPAPLRYLSLGDDSASRDTITPLAPAPRTQQLSSSAGTASPVVLSTQIPSLTTSDEPFARVTHLGKASKAKIRDAPSPTALAGPSAAQPANPKSSISPISGDPNTPPGPRKVEDALDSADDGSGLTEDDHPSGKGKFRPPFMPSPERWLTATSGFVSAIRRAVPTASKPAYATWMGPSLTREPFFCRGRTACCGNYGVGEEVDGNLRWNGGF